MVAFEFWSEKTTEWSELRRLFWENVEDNADITDGEAETLPDIVCAVFNNSWFLQN